MLYLIHLNACAYFAISAWEIKHGIVMESEDSRKKFVYDGPTDWTAYIRCFYFATKVICPTMQRLLFLNGYVFRCTNCQKNTLFYKY